MLFRDCAEAWRLSQVHRPSTAAQVESSCVSVASPSRPPSRTATRPLIVSAAGMGLRQGECFGLSVDRVDFLRRTVRVDRQVVSARGAVVDHVLARRAVAG